MPDDPPITWLDRLRNNVVLITVLLYLLFNWGFMQLRIPPVAGSGLPVGEMVLLLSLMTINYTGVLGRLSLTIAIVPLGIWWTFGVGRALFDFGVHGTWALRDAAHVLESLFLLVGFVFAGDRKSLERFFKWLPRLLVVCVIYGFLYPVRTEIWAISPTITSGTGFNVPIIGSMTNTPQIMLVAAFYLLLVRGNRFAANLVAALVIGYVLAMFQAHTNYQILIVILCFLMFYRRCSIGNIGFIICMSVILLMFVGLIGLQFEGRLGASFNIDFLVAHFLAIFGICDASVPGVCSAAEGVGQRLGWWTSIFQRMAQDPFSLLLGLGYGVALTDFYGSSGAAVREPHNSYVTVIARTGIVGAVCWVLIMLSLIRRWHQTFMMCRAAGWRGGENRLLALMMFFISMWVLAIGWESLERPYNIIPFYFFWGVILRFSLLVEGGSIGPQSAAKLQASAQSVDGSNDLGFAAQSIQPQAQQQGTVTDTPLMKDSGDGDSCPPSGTKDPWAQIRMYTRGALTMSTSTTSLWPLQNSEAPEEAIGDAAAAVDQVSAPTMSDAARVKLFLGIQIFFLFITPFCGGFHFALWSMMDTALMIQAIGITALVVVLDQEWMRVYAFRIAVLFYVSSIMAMGVAVLVSGVVGWSGVFS